MSRPPRIAIVESDDLIRQLLAGWLEPAGFLVDHTLAHRISAHDIDLIIAGVHGADSATHVLAGLRAHSDSPVLLISARFPRGAAGSVTLAGTLGAQAVLPVPFTEAELMLAVRRILGTPS